MNFAETYHRAIVWIGETTGVSDSLLHVHAGMAIFLLARLVTGRSLASPIPFLCVCVAELANEALDGVVSGEWLMADTVSDIVNTLFWPFVLMVGLRVRKSVELRDALKAQE